MEDKTNIFHRVVREVIPDWQGKNYIIDACQGFYKKKK